MTIKLNDKVLRRLVVYQDELARVNKHRRIDYSWLTKIEISRTILDRKGVVFVIYTTVLGSLSAINSQVQPMGALTRFRATARS